MTFIAGIDDMRLTCYRIDAAFRCRKFCPGLVVEYITHQFLASKCNSIRIDLLFLCASTGLAARAASAAFAANCS